MIKELNKKGIARQAHMGPARAVLFLIGVPFAIVFMFGEVLAAPLERHRNSNIVVWLLWNFLRMSVPIAIIIVAVFMLIRKLR